MTLEKAKNQALKYLSYRPRTVWEVRIYLEKKKYDWEIINQAIDYLKQLSYLDDEQFCRLWIESRIRLKPMGKKRLYAELVQKGISPDLIEQSLIENINDELELSLARDLAVNKLIKIYENKEKIINFLYRRGFAPELIFKVVEEIFS
ncbi:MAG: regulatory protein [Clostridia bacterium]|jgi:regulatory protein|nr:regulatory protein [Clostridia bacterium]MDN5324163.1 regulatory protein [Clostridia bacterium]